MDKPAGGKSLDILGVKPVAEAVKIVTEAACRQAEIFLTLICQPAAKELGLFLKDEVKEWRKANLIRIAEKAEARLADSKKLKVDFAHPKVVSQICEAGSWEDDDQLQNMWAGLLVSACNEDGKDDSNLIFAQILSQVTGRQVKLIKFLCENAKFVQDATTWVYAEARHWDFRVLVSSAGYDDADSFRTEISFLRQLGLVDVWFSRDAPYEVTCGPTILALSLYVRSQGSREPVNSYFLPYKVRELNDDVVDYPNNTTRWS